MKNVLLYIVITFSFLSCKKDRLKGDKEIFIGKWKWVFTEKITNTCEGPQSSSYLSPTTENANYSIEFLKCGKVVYYKNGEETSKDRIVFDFFQPANQINWPSYIYEFLISGDNKDERQIGGIIKSDTLILAGSKWPHYSNCDCCKIRVYLVKE